MTLSDRVTDLLARKQTPDSPTGREAASANTAGRPSLRLIPGATQVHDPHRTPHDDHAPSNDLTAALDRHAVTATHPPTLVDATGDLWLPRDQVRHGLAGQIAAAAAGLVQLAGLAACWATAHVLFATKTRAAIFALLMTVGLTTYLIAVNA